MAPAVACAMARRARRWLSFRPRFGKLRPSLQLRRDKSPKQAGAASCAWRIEYEGALYHVLSRGNQQRPIFIDNDDRLLFLETLGEMSERFEIDIFVYVLKNSV